MNTEDFTETHKEEEKDETVPSEASTTTPVDNPQPTEQTSSSELTAAVQCRDTRDSSTTSTTAPVHESTDPPGSSSSSASHPDAVTDAVESSQISNTVGLPDATSATVADEGDADKDGQEKEEAPDPPIASDTPSPPDDDDDDKPTAKPQPKPQTLVQDSWSFLSRDVLIDKVKGIIYGQAIGDALGLATEFMTKKQAAGHYGKDGPERYDQIVQDFHRSRWDQGDWTDDTDQLLLILQMIVEGKGQVDKCAFAAKMAKWRTSGFSELGDYGGMGIGMTTANTLSHHQFLSDPHLAARDIWERSGRYLAANGAVMRTAILGVLEFNDLERVVANTEEICLTTHSDPRCLASCVAVTTAIALMLQGKCNLEKEKELNKLVDEALEHGQKMLEHKDQKKELKKHIHASKLKDLSLDDRNTMGYTFKAVGAGFYGLRTAKDFLSCLRKVIAEAGDADSNGAVCGALMGCRFGFNCLPEELLNFRHRQWLDDQVEMLLKTIGLNTQ